MNREDFVLALAKALSADGRVNVDRLANAVELVDKYIQHQLQQTNVSGSLPALNGFDTWLKDKYEFQDGDWYHKLDQEGWQPMSTKELIQQFISRQ